MFISRRRRESIGLGPELLTNGDFAASGANWNVSGSDATHIVTFGVGSCRYQSDTTSPTLNVTQTGILTIGKTYRITVTVSSFTSGVLAFFLGSPFLSVNAGGTFTATLVATGTTLSFSRNSTNVDMTLSSISVRKLGS